jgi:hypothetical protein
VTDGEDSLQILTVAANVLNNSSREATISSPPACGLENGQTMSRSKNSKYYPLYSSLGTTQNVHASRTQCETKEQSQVPNRFKMLGIQMISKDTNK